MSVLTGTCRLCLQVVEEGVELFDRGDKVKSYSLQLKDTFQIKLDVRRAYPSTACVDCVGTLQGILDTVDEFRKKVQSNQEELKSRLEIIRPRVESTELQSTTKVESTINGDTHQLSSSTPVRIVTHSTVLDADPLATPTSFVYPSPGSRESAFRIQPPSSPPPLVITVKSTEPQTRIIDDSEDESPSSSAGSKSINQLPTRTPIRIVTPSTFLDGDPLASITNFAPSLTGSQKPVSIFRIQSSSSPPPLALTVDFKYTQSGIIEDPENESSDHSTSGETNQLSSRSPICIVTPSTDFDGDPLASTVESGDTQSTEIDDSEVECELVLVPETLSDLQKPKRKPGRPRTRPIRIKRQNLVKNTNPDVEKLVRVAVAAQNTDLDKFRRSEEEKIVLEEMLRKTNLLHCSECKLETPSFYELYRHMATVHNLTKKYVECCGGRYHHEGRVLDHMKYHWDKEAFKCGDCGKECLTSGHLRNHKLYVHSDPEVAKYFCQVCGKGFINQPTCIEHVKSHLPEEQREFKCDQCQRRFISERQLKDHLDAIHYKSLSHVCEFCGKGYSKGATMKAHIREQHTEKTMQQCKECGKFFFKLRIHMLNVHSGKKMPCKLCGKDFNPLYMSKHMKNIHPKDGKCTRECKICGKEIRLASFKEHMIGHTGRRNPCQFCPYSASSLPNLVKHMKKKHPQEYADLRAKRNSEKLTKNAPLTRIDDGGMEMQSS